MVTWAAGYSQSELDAAQERYGLRFPPDLVAFLRDRRPARAFDWRIDDRIIRESLAWPLEGLLFDVEHNALWLSAWGDRPSRAEARAEIVADAVARAPRLIPIYSHRYIPEAPHETGNPVFSVYQSDIIIYGDTLEAYIAGEFGDSPVGGLDKPRYIPFWSDFAGWED